YERFTRRLPAYSIENFLQGYHLPPEEYHTFIHYLADKGIVVNERKRKDLLTLIQTDIEAIVGRYYFGREAYFKARNRTDDYIKEALTVLSIPLTESQPTGLDASLPKLDNDRTSVL